MNHFKKNNKVYAFNDLQVKQGIGEEFTPITGDEADELRTPTYTEAELTEQENAKILAQITAKESELVRPMRELLSTKTDNKQKEGAQSKIDTIELAIQALRDEIR